HTACIDRLQQSHPTELSAVRGIGLSRQIHGSTLLDQTRPSAHIQPFCGTIRVIPRSARSCCKSARTSRDHKEPDDAGLTASKLLWVAQQEPHLFKRIHSVLLPKGYLRLRLSGKKVSDMSDAAGTLWLDVAARNWSVSR